MLEVTTKAKEKLKEILREETADPEIAIRVTPDYSMSKRLDLILDKEKRGDRVVLTEGGVKVLLIRPDLAQYLEGIILDYREELQGGDFIINRITRH